MLMATRERLAVMDSRLRSSRQPFGQPLQTRTGCRQGSYFPAPVRRSISRRRMGDSTRLGVPTVADRIAQQVAPTLTWSRSVEPVFTPTPYLPTRQICDRCRAHGFASRCWRATGCSSRHRGLLRQQRCGFCSRHPVNTRLSVGAALRRTLVEGASQMEVGSVVARTRERHIGGVIRPCLANLIPALTGSTCGWRERSRTFRSGNVRGRHHLSLRAPMRAGHAGARIADRCRACNLIAS